MKYIYS